MSPQYNKETVTANVQYSKMSHFNAINLIAMKI